MFTCVIIDDDAHAIEKLSGFVAEAPLLQLIATYEDSFVALNALLSGECIDLVLLDVDMPKINGLELAKEIRGKVRKLVFTTGHSKYAYDAFELDVDAFLLKPFGLGKFLVTISKLFPTNAENTQREGSKEEEPAFIFVKAKDEPKLVKVNLGDVVLIESKNNYVQLSVLERRIVTYMSLTELAKRLNGKPEFIQVQRSFIINKNFIEYIEGNTLKMVSGPKVTVGEMYRKEFNEFVTERLFSMGKKK